MTNKQAFTLIELLVVVLIIGVLAAVAVPQYQKTVEKSRAAQALTLLKTVGQAFQAHHLSSGTWATSFDELSVDIPWTGNTHFVPNCTDTRSNGQWSVCLEDATGYINLYAGRISGKYKGAYFSIHIAGPTSTNTNPVIRCNERIASGQPFVFDPSLAAGAYCEKIMRGSFLAQSEWNRSYNLP